ncbi:MAG: hypothetical protein IJN75_01345 [Clostridia bacterium]|nr:hypothetical protein [Clostridia bacterium]
MKKLFLCLTIISMILTVIGVVAVASSGGEASPLFAAIPSVLALLFYTLMKKQ